MVVKVNLWLSNAVRITMSREIEDLLWLQALRFTNAARSQMDVRSICELCWFSHHRRWYVTNRAHCLAYHKQWRTESQDQIKAKRAEHYAKNKTEIAKGHAENRDRLRPMWAKKFWFRRIQRCALVRRG